VSNLNWKTILATVLTTTVFVPIAVADTASPASPVVCHPAAANATTLPGTPTYYVREYSTFSQRHTEIWEETNGVPGLQISSFANCGGAADTLIESICEGCPMQL
jgi:hypothetical protein